MSVAATASFRARPDAAALNLTPLIDVVFQLLAFFLVSLRVLVQEGDFELHLPTANGPAANELHLPQVVPVRIDADAAGEVSGIWLGQRRLPGFAALRSEIVLLVGERGGLDAASAGTEVELDLDERLRYEHAMAAITAVTGYIHQGQVVRLVERVRFAARGPQK
jgi:biopolymer transport protein ExbD